MDVEQNTIEWLNMRKRGLGSSDAPKLTGLSPHGGPFDVYTDKTTAEHQTENPEMLRGHLLEGAVARWYEIETGRFVEQAPGILIHPQYDWMFASLDRLIVPPFGEASVRGLECKTTNRRLGRVLFDDWECQVQHQMAVAGFEVMDVAVLSGGLDFQLFEVHRDDAYIADLIDIERDFWFNHVLVGVPPEIDGTEGARQYLQNKYPKDDGEEMEAGPDERALVQMLLAVRAQLVTDKREKAKLENLIKDRMGEYTSLAGPGFKVSWKRTKDYDKVDWKRLASTYQSFYGAVAPVLEAAEWDGKDETLLSIGMAKSLYTETRQGTRRFTIRGEKGEVIEDEDEGDSE